MPPAPGDTFERYRIGALLGRGGMGAVYRAWDVRLHRTVALKILLPVEPSTEGSARIVREARAAAAIAHANAVAIYDVGEHDGVPFLAMELVEGHPLRSYVGDASVDLARRVRWLADVARALAAAHRRGVVHRDVKPENVLVSTDGTAKVVDFGIARATHLAEAAAEAPQSVREALAADAGTASALATITRAGATSGTPLYMAPEQMEGHAVDGRADQFAWGVMAYELLSGAPPWASGSVLATLTAKLSSPPAPLAAIVPDLATHVAAAVTRALARAAADRFPDMHAVVRAMEPDARGESAPPPGASSKATATLSMDEVAPTRAAAAAPRRRGRWLALGAAALAVGAVLARTRRAPPSDAPAPRASTSAPRPGMSGRADAVAAFTGAQAALRDAFLPAALDGFDRATTLDDDFALAHLAYVTVPRHEGDARFARHVRRAFELRAVLGPDDRELLDAVEPLTLPGPSVRETERRLAALLARAPSNVDEVARLDCWALVTTTEFARALEVCADANRRAPAAWPLWMKARAHGYLGDEVGARAAWEECAHVAPRSTRCLSGAFNVASNAGACEEAARTARRYVELDPENMDARALLAGALIGSDQPLDAVREALAPRWTGGTPSAVARRRIDDAALAVLEGALSKAADALAGVDLEESTLDRWHRHELLLEAGRGREAAAAAEVELRRMAGRPDDTELPEAPVAAAAILYRAGAIPRAEMVRRRAAWLASITQLDAGRTDVVPWRMPLAWLYAYAMPVVTEEDARDAMAALPSFGSLTAEFATPRYDRLAGRVFLLAGDTARALPPLLRAARSCAPFDDPLHASLALADLGEVRVRSGDARGACEAYGTLARRWRFARLGAEARRRRVALGCQE